MRLAGILAGGALVALAGCHGLGNLLEEALKERPAAPLDAMGVASDARIDSAGVLAGSFVGEGTARGVHLLSSDTVFIAELARRYRPDLFQGRPWLVTHPHDRRWNRIDVKRALSAERRAMGLPDGQR